jgi:predicted kinase
VHGPGRFGRADVAHRLLNAYLEITGDYKGLATWRFYLVYRAMVRAKVAAIRTQQSSEQKDRDAAAAEVTTYLQLADGYIHPRVPKLFITHGPSGSGKSTLTQPLLEALGAVRIRSDAERRRPQLGTGDADRYSNAARQRVYEHMERLAASVLASGLSTIVDATFLSRPTRARFHRVAERLSAEFVILDFQTPAHVLRERVAQRQKVSSDVSDANLEVLTSQLRSAEPLDADELDVAITVDTTRTDAAESVARRLTFDS